MSPNGDPITEQAAPPDAAAQRLLLLIAEMLHELRPEAPLQAVHLDDAIERDLGLDSLSRIELVLRIERSFGTRLPERIATTARTLRDLLEAIGKTDLASGAISLPLVSAPLPEAVQGTPEQATTLLGAFCWHLEHHPDRDHITLLEGDRTLETISYGRLWTDANALARGFAALGIERGDTVALMLPTSSAFFQAFLGAMLVGATPVPMYPPLRWSDIEAHVRGRAAILSNCKARVLVTVPEAAFVGRILRAELPDLRAVVAIDHLRGVGRTFDLPGASGPDAALLQYTSGSTGDPKGVILSHDNLLANIRAMGAAARATSGDRFVSWLPLYHDMGLIGAWLATLYYAIPLVLMPPASFLSRPARWLRIIHRFRATISAGPNFAYEIVASKVLDEDLTGLDLSSWRLAFNGAEPVRAATLERFAARFAPYGFNRRALTPVYGLAESALGLTFPPLGRGPWVERIDPRALADEGVACAAPSSAGDALEVVSCGRPLPGHEIRVVDEAGREAASHAEGRIEFRGPSATVGYHRNPEATAKLFHSGWLDTGDVGYISGGELFLTSRAKDLIKRGGHNIHPYDLEAAIGEIPGMRKGCVAVFGMADRVSGTERVVVVAETNQTDPSSRAALRERIVALASIHLNGPADEVLLASPHTVLKTSSGKIRRAACRELYERGLLQTQRRAVWLQLARLTSQAVVARLRRGARALSQAAYGIYCWLAFLLLSAAAIPMLILLTTARARRHLAHSVAKLLMRACGIAPSVTGRGNLDASKPMVIVANHASYVDAILLTAVLPPDVHFVAKRGFERARAMAWVMRRLGTYFVERADATRGLEDTRELATAVKRGETVVFFPEGTFSRAPGLEAFHLGAFVVSTESGAPVIPIVLRGTRSVLRENRWLPLRYPVEVSIQPAIAPRGCDWSAAVQLRDQVREAMLRHCGEPDLTYQRASTSFG